jgi:hypothetical protein
MGRRAQVKLPTIRSQHFDTLVQRLLSSVDACARRSDIGSFQRSVRLLT